MARQAHTPGLNWQDRGTELAGSRDWTGRIAGLNWQDRGAELAGWRGWTATVTGLRVGRPTSGRGWACSARRWSAAIC